MADEKTAEEQPVSAAEQWGRPPAREVAEEIHRQFHPSHPQYQNEGASPSEPQRDQPSVDGPPEPAVRPEDEAPADEPPVGPAQAGETQRNDPPGGPSSPQSSNPKGAR